MPPTEIDIRDILLVKNYSAFHIACGWSDIGVIVIYDEDLLANFWRLCGLNSGSLISLNLLNPWFALQIIVDDFGEGEFR